MKKLTLAILFCAFFMAANASDGTVITKPRGGDMFFELKASGINTISTGLNSTYGGVMVRSFMSENRANRFSADLSLFIGEDDTEISYFHFNWGLENHMTGSDRMSTYWGFDVGIAAFDSFDYFNLMGGLFTGFDYFIADGLYLGAETGLRLYIDSDPLEIVLPGVRMNASFKLGYRF